MGVGISPREPEVKDRLMLFAASLLPTLVTAIAIQSTTVMAGDLDVLIGAKWKGTLTYLDFSEDKKVWIPAEMVFRKGLRPNSWVATYTFPDEPNEKSEVNIALKLGGRAINDEAVIERRMLSDGTLLIATSHRGTDNGKRAELRRTYLIGLKRLVITKDVRYEGEKRFFMRNEFLFSRN